MTNYDLVKKLIGEIEPVGESHTDEKRYENLKEFIDLVYELIQDLHSVAGYENNYQHSMKKAGEHVRQFLFEIRSTIDPEES